MPHIIRVDFDGSSVFSHVRLCYEVACVKYAYTLYFILCLLLGERYSSPLSAIVFTHTVRIYGKLDMQKAVISML